MDLENQLLSVSTLALPLATESSGEHDNSQNPTELAIDTFDSVLETSSVEGEE